MNQAAGLRGRTLALSSRPSCGRPMLCTPTGARSISLIATLVRPGSQLGMRSFWPGRIMVPDRRLARRTRSTSQRLARAIVHRLSPGPTTCDRALAPGSALPSAIENRTAATPRRVRIIVPRYGRRATGPLFCRAAPLFRLRSARGPDSDLDQIAEDLDLVHGRRLRAALRLERDGRALDVRHVGRDGDGAELRVSRARRQEAS